jgi:hypothetical protein
MFGCVLPLCPYDSTRLKDGVRNERTVFRKATASAKNPTVPASANHCEKAAD